jgi:hypothetical protein
MSIDSNLSALSAHFGRLTLLTELPEHVRVPREWRPFLHASAKEALTHIMGIWRACYPHEFDVLLEAFAKYLVSVQLVEADKRIALLYTFKNPKGQYVNYIGHTPLLPHQVPAAIQGLPWPDKFLGFYTHVHNGWYEVESHAMGLMPVEEAFPLSDMEWGIVEELSIDYALDKVLAVFSNSAGGYLCWNFNTGEPSGLVWWDDEEPDAADFWDILDEWAAMGIAEY